MDRFKLLESFVAVAKSGSYSAAARQLGVSRALMSKRIMALEARLGARLFNRNTHQLSLTDAGVTYFSSCRSVLTELEAAEASLLERRKVPRGSLRVLTSQNFGYMHMASAAAGFMRRYPEIDLYMSARELGRQTVDLVAGGYDLALRTQTLPDSSLVVRKVAPLDWLIVAAPAYLAAHGIPASLDDLAQHRCLVTASQPGYRWDLEAEGKPGVVKCPAIGVSNLNIVTRDAALASLGLALLPEYGIASDLAAGRLVRVLPAYRGRQRSLLAVYPRDRTPPLKTRLFIDFLVERFRDCSWSELLTEAQIGPLVGIPEPLFRRRPALAG
jgi:DNA-binding transcriptional LysR family regulator